MVLHNSSSAISDNFSYGRMQPVYLYPLTRARIRTITSHTFSKSTLVAYAGESKRPLLCEEFL